MLQPTILIDLAQDSGNESWLAEFVNANQVSVIISNVSYKSFETVGVNAALNNSSFLLEQGELAKSLDVAIDMHSLHTDEWISAFGASRAAFWETNLLELHKWLHTIKSVLGQYQHQHSRVQVYIPNAPTSDQIYLYEAEGETSKKGMSAVLYQRTDYLLFYIRAHLSKLVNVEPVSYFLPSTRKWRSLMLVRICRTYGVLLLRCALHVRNRMRHKRMKGSEKVGMNGSGSSVLAITRGQAHTEYLLNLMADLRVKVLVCDNFLSYPSNYSLFRSLVGDRVGDAHLYDLLTVGSILRSAFRVIVSLLRFEWVRHARRIDLPWIAKNYHVDINLDQVLRESLLNSFEALLLSGVVQCYLNVNPQARAVIHCEQITHYPYYLHQAARQAGALSVQVAFGTYDIRPTPRFYSCDYLCCYSETMRKSLVELFPSDHDVISYWGNLFMDESAHAGSMIGGRESSKSIVFFTQPYDDTNERCVVDALKQWCLSEGWKLHLALHPRDPENKYEGDGQGVVTWTHEKLLPERSRLMGEVVFALTRTSNVAYYLILAGVPLVNILWSAHDETISHEYYRSYPLLARSKEEMLLLLASPAEAIQAFDQFRDAYLSASWGLQGWQSFINELSARYQDMPARVLRRDL